MSILPPRYTLKPQRIAVGVCLLAAAVGERRNNRRYREERRQFNSNRLNLPVAVCLFSCSVFCSTDLTSYVF
jgi:hypothetical protein